MADLSLHYSSKAPLAGTFAAFSRIFAAWRQRAKERKELSTLDARTAARPRSERQRRQFRGQQALLA